MRGKISTLLCTSIERKRSPSGGASERAADRREKLRVEGYQVATWANEREILGLKADFLALKREVAVIALNLLDLSGAMESALREDRKQRAGR